MFSQSKYLSAKFYSNRMYSTHYIFVRAVRLSEVTPALIIEEYIHVL
jgi:hypothetical protein